MEKYFFPTDIVFSRPNYCKIDLMVENNRGDQLFFQADELLQVMESLKSHGFTGGLSGLVRLSEDVKEVGGGVSTFLDFLREQEKL